MRNKYNLFTREKLEELKQHSRYELYNMGYCDPEIAEIKGVSRGAITSWRKSKELPSVFKNRKRVTSSEMHTIERFLTNRYTAQTAGEYKKDLIHLVMKLNKPLFWITGEDYEYWKSYIMNNNLRISIKALRAFCIVVIKPYVLKRDGYKCQMCGSKENLQIHHEILSKKYAPINIDNLVTLCKDCHINKLHGEETTMPREDTTREIQKTMIHIEKEINELKDLI